MQNTVIFIEYTNDKNIQLPVVNGIERTTIYRDSSNEIYGLKTNKRRIK